MSSTNDETLSVFQSIQIFLTSSYWTLWLSLVQYREEDISSANPGNLQETNGSTPSRKGQWSGSSLSRSFPIWHVRANAKHRHGHNASLALA